MTSWLRAVGLAAVIGALLDPGCDRARRPTLAVAFAGDGAAGTRTEEMARIASEAPWATVLEAGHVPDEAQPTRVVVGEAAPVLAHLEQRPAALAWQATAPSLVLVSAYAPARLVSGTRADIVVRVGGAPGGTRAVRVVVSDATTGGEQARAEVAPTVRGTGDDTVAVSVPWLATRAGEQRLRLVASTPGDGAVAPSAPGEITVDVRPPVVRVDVLETRPTWAARFARLALSQVAGVEVRTEVRVAPGIAARTAPSATRAGTARQDADVRLVGGVDTLTNDDVTRLEAGVRDRGQAVILLMDEPPGAGPWRRLWPGFSASLRSAPVPVLGRIGGHGWKVREWLDVDLSTDGTPLAFLESSSAPIVVGRSLGAGRVVMVTALDAWRWRADADTAFAAGWRALVQRLGADVPAEVAMTAWASGRRRERMLQVDVAARPDVLHAGPLAVTAQVGSPGRPLLLHEVASGRWRGAVRVGAGEAESVRVTARNSAGLARQAEATVDVRPMAPVASWDDVARYQAARGHLSAAREARAAAMRRLRESLRPSEDRWFVTRTWWFAGLALCVFGAEWLLRRLAGAR